MSALNLHSTTGIIYIVLIIVACLGLLFYKKNKFICESKRRQKASERLYPTTTDGGKRRNLKRQSK